MSEPLIKYKVVDNGIATVIPSVHEGDPVRVVVKAENGDILGEYRLHFTNDKDLLASKPVVAVKTSRLVAKGHTLELPAKVAVYFSGKDGYEVKDLAVEWNFVHRCKDCIGTTPGFWMNLQVRYELDRAEDALGDTLRGIVPLTTVKVA